MMGVVTMALDILSILAVGEGVNAPAVFVGVLSSGLFTSLAFLEVFTGENFLCVTTIFFINVCDDKICLM